MAYCIPHGWHATGVKGVGGGKGGIELRLKNISQKNLLLKNIAPDFLLLQNISEEILYGLSESFTS